MCWAPCSIESELSCKMTFLLVLGVMKISAGSPMLSDFLVLLCQRLIFSKNSDMRCVRSIIHPRRQSFGTRRRWEGCRAHLKRCMLGYYNLAFLLHHARDAKALSMNERP